jgi:hypothetical protein
MLSDVMLNIVMLSVIMLNVVVPCKMADRGFKNKQNAKGSVSGFGQDAPQLLN